MACSKCGGCVDPNTECINCRDICGCLEFTSSDDTVSIVKTNCTVDVTVDTSGIVVHADGSETKINAGSGISRTGSGTTGSPYVISNIGVLSVNGNAGAVTVPIADGSETIIEAGSNIGVTGSGTSGDPYEIAFTGTNICATTIKPFAGADCCKSLDQALVFSGGLKATTSSGHCWYSATIDVNQSCTINYSTNFSALADGSGQHRINLQLVYIEAIYAKFRGYMKWVVTTVPTTYTSCFNTINAMVVCAHPNDTDVPYPATQFVREWIVTGINSATDTPYQFLIKTDSVGNYYMRGFEGITYPSNTTYHINMETVMFETK